MASFDLTSLDELLSDQKLRWRKGDSVSAESYLSNYDWLRRDTRAVRQLIYAEIRLREEHGEDIEWEEIERRFPDHFSAVRQMHLAERESKTPRADVDPNSTVDPTALIPAPSTIDVTESRRASGSTPRSKDQPQSATNAELPTIPGYELQRELARGGMGRVLAARDLTLDREVAIKVLLPHAKADRFVTESKITACLPHPSIPPVYALGQLTDGSPYLVMKLIRGRTLAEELRELGARPERLSHFLAIFEQICQAVGFAHSQGIVHRDLKPTNVMLGAFGEVQVMDWGLAKHLGEAGEPNTFDPQKTLPLKRRPEPEGNSSLTEFGQVLGTPAYLPPEQARGEPADARADVFMLGGILTCLITGRPTFIEASSQENVRRSARADLDEVFQRLDQSSAEPELVAFCKQCLSPARQDRPADGREVARRIADYRNSVTERWQQAEQRRVTAEATANVERKRRRLLVALIGFMLLVAAVALGLGRWQYQALASVERSVNQALEDVRRELGQMPQASTKIATWQASVDSALAAQSRAEALLEKEKLFVSRSLLTSVADTRRQVDAEAKMFRFGAGIEYAMRSYTEVDTQKSRFKQENVLPRIRQAFLDGFGLQAGESSPEEAAGRLNAAPTHVRPYVLTGLYCSTAFLASEKQSDELTWVLATIRGFDHDNPWRAKMAQAFDAKDSASIAALFEDQAMRSQPPGVLVAYTHLMKSDDKARLAMLRQIQAVFRNDFSVNQLLADALLDDDPAHPERSLPYFEASLAIEPGNGGAYLNYGNALEKCGDKAAAIRVYQQGIHYAPEYAALHNNLGLRLEEAGDIAGAKAAFERAKSLLPSDPIPYVSLGRLLINQKQWSDAERECRESLKRKPGFSVAHQALGDALRGMQRSAEAIPEYLAALEREPDDAECHVHLGLARSDTGDKAGAMREFREALRIKPKLFPAHFNLGNHLKEAGRLAEALPHIRKAAELEPNRPEGVRALALAHMAAKEWDLAVAALKAGLEQHPRNAELHVELGDAYLGNRQRQLACEAYEHALQIDPQFQRAHNNWGLALQQQGDFMGAVKHFRLALELKPTDSTAHYNLGCSLAARGDMREATKAFQAAVALDPKNLSATINLGNCYAVSNDAANAVVAYEKAIELEPNQPELLRNVGVLRKQLGNLPGALAAFRECIRLNPRYLSAYNNLGTTLTDIGQHQEAMDLYRQALALAPGDPELHVNLAIALRDTGDYAGALTAFERAHELGSRQPNWNHPSTGWINHARGLIKRDAQLATFRERGLVPEKLEDLLRLADFAVRDKKQPWSAFRLYEIALKREIPADQLLVHRYNASCAAILAAEDGSTPADRRESCRTTALTWIKQELELIADLWQDPQARSEVRPFLAKWAADTDLASVRDDERLRKLPPAEQESWRSVWAAVARQLANK